MLRLLLLVVMLVVVLVVIVGVEVGLVVVREQGPLALVQARRSSSRWSACLGIARAAR